MAAVLKATQTDILAAAKIYCDRVNDRAKSEDEKISISEGEDKRIRFIVGGVTTDHDIMVWTDNERLKSNDPEFAAMVFSAILKGLGQEPTSAPKSAQKPAERANVPAVPRKPSDDFDMSDWRQKQAKTYSVAGKTAPNAFALSEEANKRGLCTQIIDAGRSKDLVWGHVRVTDPKTQQFREDRVSHERETFCLLKAWEDANSQARYQKPGQPPLIIGIDEQTSMPIMNPDLKIKGMPASLWLTMQVMRSWSMADRDAVTKAERRAQLKIMNRDWREDGEIALEVEEEAAVRDMIDRKGGEST